MAWTDRGRRWTDPRPDFCPGRRPTDPLTRPNPAPTPAVGSGGTQTRPELRRRLRGRQGLLESQGLGPVMDSVRKNWRTRGSGVPSITFNPWGVVLLQKSTYFILRILAFPLRNVTLTIVSTLDSKGVSLHVREDSCAVDPT